MKERKGFLRVVDNFVPSWYAMVMGTIGLAISIYYSSTLYNFLYWVGYGFFVFSIVLFILFLVPWTLRFFVSKEKTDETLSSPIYSSFIPTMPISLVLISFGLLTFKDHTFLGEANTNFALILFWIGGILVVIMGFLIISKKFLNPKVELSHANFGWFIPPVAHIIVTRVGIEFISLNQRGPISEIIFWFSMFCLAVGLFMYIFIGSIVMFRYKIGEIPSGNLAPTTFIQLAPLGIFATIFAQITYLFGSSSIGILIMFSILFWSFGIWWFVMSIIILINQIKNNQLPFAMSWWAFVFPLVALTLGTVAMSNISSKDASIIFSYLALVFNGVTTIFWITVFIETIKRVAKRELL
ncbi:MAG: hypothetical protein N2712_07455 [Brevinematales bacterium]|nr:hypothetical protein [Brevinematales bacterium]